MLTEAATDDTGLTTGWTNSADNGPHLKADDDDGDISLRELNKHVVNVLLLSCSSTCVVGNYGKVYQFQGKISHCRKQF